MAANFSITLLATGLALVIAEVWRGRRRLGVLRAEYSRLHELRLAERSGRTAAERRLRQAEVAHAASSTPPTAESVALCRYRPIGRIESCYVERRGTPRQGLLVTEARSRLRLDPQVIQPSAALEGLEGYSHVWLIFDFHENTNANKAAATAGGRDSSSAQGDAGSFSADAPLSKRARGKLLQRERQQATGRGQQPARQDRQEGDAGQPSAAEWGVKPAQQGQPPRGEPPSAQDSGMLHSRVRLTRGSRSSELAPQ